MEKFFELIPSLSPQSQQLVKAMIRQLCENEGINLPREPALGLQTLEEGLPLWESWLVGQSYSKGSVRLYTYYVGHLLRRDTAPTPLSVQKRLSNQLLRGISPTAVKSEFKALKSFFGYLHDQGLWPENPVRTLKPPRVPKREVKAPSPEEVLKLLSVADRPKLVAMLILFLDTGIRFSELSHLKWERVNFDSGEITVIGKGNKGRTIPISPIAGAILQSLKNGHAHSDDLVFPSRSIEGWDNRDANRSLARLCRKAGIKKYTCHQFRHFFATYTLQRGGDLKAVSEILGHAQTSTTVDFYLHTDKARIKKTHDEHAPFAQPMLPEGRSEPPPAVRRADLLRTVIQQLEALESHQPSPGAVTMTVPVQVQALPGQN